MSHGSEEGGSSYSLFLSLEENMEMKAVINIMRFKLVIAQVKERWLYQKILLSIL